MDTIISGKLSSQVFTSSMSNVQLDQPSVVSMPVARDQVASVTRNGMDLLIDLKNGEHIRLTNFFISGPDAVTSDLIFQQDDGTLWKAEPDPGNGFTFEKIESIDNLLIAPTAAKSTLLPWAIGLGAIGAGAGVAALAGGGGGGSSNDESVTVMAPANLLVEDAGLVLTGTGQADTRIEARASNGTLLGSGVVAADGSFTVDFEPPQTTGQTLLVNAVDAAGNTSAVVETLAPDIKNPEPDTTLPSAPEQVAISNGGDLVSGRGEPGSKVTIIDADGTTLETGQVNTDGLFSITLEQPQRNGETLQVYLEDDAGNASPSVSLQAPDTMPPEQPHELWLSSDGMVLNGTAESECRIEVRDLDSVLMGTGRTDSSGIFSVTFASAQLNAERFDVWAVDAAGNMSMPAPFNAPDTIPPASPTDIVISSDRSTLSGKGQAGNSVSVLNAEDAEVGSGFVQSTVLFSLASAEP